MITVEQYDSSRHDQRKIESYLRKINRLLESIINDYDEIAYVEVDYEDIIALLSRIYDYAVLLNNTYFQR